MVVQKRELGTSEFNLWFDKKLTESGKNFLDFGASIGIGPSTVSKLRSVSSWPGIRVYKLLQAMYPDIPKPDKDLVRAGARTVKEIELGMDNGESKFSGLYPLLEKILEKLDTILAKLD